MNFFFKYFFSFFFSLFFLHPPLRSPLFLFIHLDIYVRKGFLSNRRIRFRICNNYLPATPKLCGFICPKRPVPLLIAYFWASGVELLWHDSQLLL